jgi:hypothetical protein
MGDHITCRHERDTPYPTGNMIPAFPNPSIDRVWPVSSAQGDPGWNVMVRVWTTRAIMLLSCLRNQNLVKLVCVWLWMVHGKMFNSLRTGGILRKIPKMKHFPQTVSIFQMVPLVFCGTIWKLVSRASQWVPMLRGFDKHLEFSPFLFSHYGYQSRPPSLNTPRRIRPWILTQLSTQTVFSENRN